MGRCGGYAKTVSTVVPGDEGRDPASFAGTPGVDERLQPGTAGQGGDGDKTVLTLSWNLPSTGTYMY